MHATQFFLCLIERSVNEYDCLKDRY